MTEQPPTRPVDYSGHGGGAGRRKAPTDPAPLIPTAETVLAAWLDVEAGLQVLRRYTAARENGLLQELYDLRVRISGE